MTAVSCSGDLLCAVIHPKPLSVSCKAWESIAHDMGGHCGVAKYNVDAVVAMSESGDLLRAVIHLQAPDGSGAASVWTVRGRNNSRR